MATALYGDTKTYSANIVTNPTSQPVNYAWVLPNGGGTPTSGSGSTFTVTWGNTTATFPVNLTVTAQSNGCAPLLVALPVDVSGPTWYGFNLTPVFAGTCDPSGLDITAYNQTGGSLVINNQLFATQNVNDNLPAGTYSNGSVIYTVNGGVITNIQSCPGGCTSITSVTIIQS